MAESGINILSALCTEYKKFFDAEKRIADYIIKNEETAAHITQAQLAQESATSEATVSRFCKRLGMESYRDFQLALARDVAQAHQSAYTPTNDISLSNVPRSLQNILANKVAELTSTFEMIAPDELKSIIRQIQAANLIEIAAVGNTIPVAMDAAFKFNQLGLKCVTDAISEKLSAFALALSERDLLIIISNSGKSRRLLQIARAAKSNRTPLLVITNDKESPLALLADYVLAGATREKLLTGDFSFSRVSSVALIEVLYLFLFADSPAAKENIRRHECLLWEDKNMGNG